MSYFNVQFSTLVVLVSGLVHSLICLKMLAEITNVTFRSQGCSLPVLSSDRQMDIPRIKFRFLTLHKRSRSRHCCSA